MADSSRRAAANPRKGGLPNALFLVAAAEELPGPLVGRVDLVTIVLPWGSLLRGLLAADRDLIAGITDLACPEGDIEILVSATDRDAAAHGFTLVNEADADGLVERLESAGLRVLECRPADQSDVARLSSGWGKRLGIPTKRQAWFLRLRRSLA